MRLGLKPYAAGGFKRRGVVRLVSSNSFAGPEVPAFTGRAGCLEATPAA